MVMDKHVKPVRTLAAAAFAMWTAHAAAQSCIARPDGAVYWLSGDHNYDDLAGWHNATFVGPGVGYAEDGVVAQGVHFGGALENRIYTNTSYPEERAVRDAFTIELWARPAAALTPCAESNSGTCAEAEPWAVFPEHGNNSAPPGETGRAAGIGVAIGTDGVCVGEHAANLFPCLARVDATIAGWMHVAVVVENNTPRIYLDGALVHTGATSDRDFVFASWSVLGSVDIGGYGPYAGDIDELTIYDRALGADEIGAIVAAGADGKCRPECVVDHHDDLWEHPLIGAHSALRSDRADCLFGDTGCSPESLSLLFGDGLPDGTVQFVEWETPTPVTLGAISLYAFHDAFDNTQRAFRHVRIAARDSGGAMTTIYESGIVLPYAQGDEGRELFRCVNVRPIRSGQFRAEFVQDGEGIFSGSRVVELDGLVYDPIFAHDFEPPH
jgi:hypothetical protein